MMAKKNATVSPATDGKARKCPITRAQFLTLARQLHGEIAGEPVTARIKSFSTGSFGWNISGKIEVQVGDQLVTVQVGANLIIVGSKEAL